ncbi:Hypothetical_protein [Hexamita inflata]|uniref:Hypothetical_protein n=1 Tax=Hexamita inflata TaxID=28002 RepID=A0AA86PCY7_9EUKA|nr:Hypothetical protein HINF_LOCUS22793 [Hexamita inflata]
MTGDKSLFTSMLRKRIMNSHLPQTLKRICESNGSQNLSQSNNTEDFAQINHLELIRNQILDITFQINVQINRLNFLNEYLEQSKNKCLNNGGGGDLHLELYLQQNSSKQVYKYD